MTSVAVGSFNASPSPASWIGVVLGGPLVLLGMVFLILDLGVKNNATRAFLNVRTSWMARGAWIISTFAVLDIAQLFFSLLHLPWPAGASLVAAGLAVATMFYTGFLLKACRPITFWSTMILPVLFLASASSTGVMLVVLGTVAYGSTTGSVAALSTADVFLILAESLVIVVFLLRGERLQTSRGSVQLWVRGRLAAGFWGGVVVCGLLVPLVAESYQAAAPLLATCMLLGLTGGLVLRRIVLAAGIRRPLIDSVVFRGPAGSVVGEGGMGPASGQVDAGAAAGLRVSPESA